MRKSPRKKMSKQKKEGKDRDEEGKKEHSSRDEVDEFVSDEAYEVMVKKI